MSKYTKKDEVSKLESTVETKVKDDVKEVKETKREKVSSKKKVFEPSEGIMCRSVVTGALYLEGSKTKMPYVWSNYGDETEVEYRDLVALVREQSGYLFNPFFIVENEDFISEFPHLEKFYSANYSIKELSEILELPVEQMISSLKVLPKTAINTIKKIAANQVSVGQIDSVRKIKALDEFFGTDLNLIAEIFQQ